MMCATFMYSKEWHDEKTTPQKRQETILTGKKKGKVFIFGKRSDTTTQSDSVSDGRALPYSL